MSKEISQAELNQAIIKRLDAIIRLYIETNKPEKKMKFSEGEAIRLLKSVDLTPTEIAKILGKKSATDVSYALYSKKEKTEGETKQLLSQ
jgi:predicted DNA-binding antitoxin AbrB/MazE fold protein